MSFIPDTLQPLHNFQFLRHESNKKMNTQECETLFAQQQKEKQQKEEKK